MSSLVPVEIKELRIPIRQGAHSLFVKRVVHHTDTPDNCSPLFTILVVHGGPGLSDHTESYHGLIQLLEHCPLCHDLVFYDQLGCGASDKPSSFPYSLHYYTSELSQVIEACATMNDTTKTKICLLGHSWGGQVVLEYLLHTNVSPHVHGAIISNAPLDESSYEQRQQYLRSQLDKVTQQFVQADELSVSQDGSVGAQIYQKLIGTSETSITGDMKGWSLLENAETTKLIHKLPLPCLFVTGKLDTVPWEDYQKVKTVLEAVETASSPSLQHQVHILEQGDHGPFFGSTAVEYFAIIRSFLESLVVTKDSLW